ncbi:alanine acetyltransferase [Actinomyces radicidentis]|uniref:Alanine acetyltransferase n=1 Tax=Actinomyces radicidentis TaxID=111015 RepID=A0A120KMJ1_ACTRD|nr:GNAT family N-acetyltransferase [Actinomyces radicidentis]AMD87439.1 alanine acetyltransferase [Actinomyces radicidentis]
MTAPSSALGAGGPVLRPARPDDVPELARLESELFGGEAWSEPLLVDELAAASGSGADRVYVVVEEPGEDGEPLVLGYAGAWFGDGRGSADLLTIATVPAARRRGIATAMLEHLVGLVADRGCQDVLLEVRASNEGAQRLYAAHGFEGIGTRRRYYLAPVEDALVMRRVLRAPAGPGPVGAEAL